MPTLIIKPALISKKAILNLSWPYKANWDLLNSLNNGCYLSGENEHDMAPQTILLFSLTKLLEYKLSGSALDSSRGKFTNLKVDCQHNSAIITLTTEPTFSAVRKVLSIVSKNFAPAKLTVIYKKYSQLLGIKISPGEFVYCVDEMLKGIKNLSVFCTGTIKIPDGKISSLKDIVDTIKPESADGKAETPKSVTTVLKTWDELKCTSSLDAFLVQQLLNTMQIESHIRDGALIPITGSTKWDTVKSKVDTSRIDRFVEQKLIKLGDKLPDVMRLLCAQTGYFTSSELDKLPSSYTASSIKIILKKYF